MLILNLLKSCKNKCANKLVRKKQKKNGVFDIWFAFFSSDSNSPSIFFFWKYGWLFKGWEEERQQDKLSSAICLIGCPLLLPLLTTT
jgi:hypothetical protein